MNLHPETGAERPQLLQISLGGWRQDTEHQRSRVLGHRDLHLWHSGPDIEGGEQRSQGFDEAVERRCQDLATPEIGDQGRRAFAEADYDPALLAHESRPQTGAAPIVPGLRHQRCQHGVGLDARGALQLLEQVFLLRRDLRRGIEMLQ